MKNYSAFTTTSNGLANKLINEAYISNGKEAMHTPYAQWDTGATKTCISQAVVDRLGLIPIANTMMYTPSGMRLANIYIVDITLRNNVTVKDVQVIGSEIGGQGIDVLIGMDIITLGDFAVTNVDGITRFSFRILSCETIDYVAQIHDLNK